MPVSLQEIEEAHLDTSAFERYLRAHSWEFEAETRGGARQWQRGEHRMLLPAPESRESALRFYDALAVLARAESKDTRVLLGAVANAAERTVVVTVDEGSAPGGTISLEAGSELIRGVTSLVELAVDRALPGFGPTSEPNQYLNKVLLGPTTIGSFGLTVYLPEGGQRLSDRVASELIGSVRVAADLVVQQPALVRAQREFTVPQFAQLTRSFVELLADDETRHVGLATVDGPAELRPSGELQGAWLPQLRMASLLADRELALQETAAEVAAPPPREMIFEDVRLDGPVVALNRPWVTVSALTPEGRRRVRFRLGAKAYLEAVTAHREERWVTVTGLLRIRRQSAQLLEVTEFRPEG
jgi:hypothetical protein